MTKTYLQVTTVGELRMKLAALPDEASLHFRTLDAFAGVSVTVPSEGERAKFVAIGPVNAKSCPFCS